MLEVLRAARNDIQLPNLAEASLIDDADMIALRHLVRDYLDRPSVASLPDVAYSADGSGQDHDSWQRMAVEQGWPALDVEPDYGGSGATFAQLCAVVAECGARLVFGSLLSTGVRATALLASCAAPDRAAYLPLIGAGKVRVATPDWFPDAATSFRAIRTGAGWRLDGEAGFVLDATRSDLLLTLAECTGDRALFAVATEAPGVDVVGLESLDPTRPLGSIRLTAAPAVRLSTIVEPDRCWQLARLRTGVALAGEQVAASRALLMKSVTYLGIRRQFGRPLASFQALKHRCADILVNIEAAESATRAAVWASEHDEAQLPLLASVAQASASAVFSWAASESIQLHGGIGFTWEHDAHRYFRRARADEVLLGSVDWHRREIANVLGVGPTTAART